MSNSTIELAATVSEKDGKPVLRVKGLTIPITLAQLLYLVVGGKAPIEKESCRHANAYGAACLKTIGHKGKHQYLRKQFKKKKVSPTEDQKPTYSADSRARRRAAGLCSWCDNKPVEGKKLCANHLVGARKVLTRIKKKQKAG